MRVKSASELERQIRTLKRENLLLIKDHQRLLKANLLLSRTNLKLESEIARLTDANNYTQGM